MAFLSGFRVGGEFIYRDRLRSSLLLHHHSLEVDLRDLGVWNEELGQKVQEQPGEMVPLVRDRRITDIGAPLTPARGRVDSARQVPAQPYNRRG